MGSSHVLANTVQWLHCKLTFSKLHLHLDVTWWEWINLLLCRVIMLKDVFMTLPAYHIRRWRPEHKMSPNIELKWGNYYYYYYYLYIPVYLYTYSGWSQATSTVLNCLIVGYCDKLPANVLIVIHFRESICQLVIGAHVGTWNVGVMLLFQCTLIPCVLWGRLLLVLRIDYRRWERVQT